MSFISLLHLFAFLGDIALIAFLISRNYRALLNWLCALIIAAFGIWSLGYFVMPFMFSMDSALFWVNVSSFGWISFPVITLYFYLVLTGKKNIYKNKYLLIGSLLVVGFLIYQQWRGNIIGQVWPTTYGWFEDWNHTPFTYLYYGYFGVVVFFVFFLNYNYVRKAKTNRQRIQARLLLVTAIVSIVLGTTINVVIPNLHIKSIPQMGDIFVFIWLLAVVIGITRYGLMDVTISSAARQILDTTTDMLLLVDTNGVIKHFNQAALDLLKTTKDKIKGMKFADLAANNGVARGFLEKTLITGKSANQEIAFNQPDGSLIIALVSASVVEDRTKTLLGYVVSAKDITELHRTQMALQYQKELTERILNTMPNSVIVVRKDQRIELVNKAFLTMFSKQNDEVIGDKLGDLLPLDELLEEISRVLSHEESYIRCEFKYVLTGKDYVFVTHILQMPEDEVLVILNDVTEERTRQDRLYLTDRLASIGEMASGIAHEINNPLTGIIGLTSFIEKRDIPEDIAEDMATIHIEAQRCAAIVKNLLSFARRHTPERKSQNIADILEDVLKLRAHDHRIHNISVVKTIQPDLPAVLVDYYQIQQVFLNIVLNAESSMIETRQEGTLKIVIDSFEDGVRINFKDDGTGIKPENIRMIFNPFFTTKKVGKGTGLGLSICYGIITSHHGRIYAMSDYGKGAEFVVELPVAK